MTPACCLRSSHGFHPALLGLLAALLWVPALRAQEMLPEAAAPVPVAEPAAPAPASVPAPAATLEPADSLDEPAAETVPTVKDVVGKPWRRVLPTTVAYLVASAGALPVVGIMASAAASWMAVPFLYLSWFACGSALFSSGFLPGSVAIILAYAGLGLVCGTPLFLTFVGTPVAAGAALATWLPLPWVELAHWMSTMAKDAADRKVWRSWAVASVVGGALPLAALVAAGGVHMAISGVLASMLISTWSQGRLAGHPAVVATMAPAAWCVTLPLVAVPLMLLELPVAVASLGARTVTYGGGAALEQPATPGD